VSIFLAASLSLFFDDTQPRRVFFLFEIRLFRDPPYLDTTMSVLANDSLAPCSISVSGRSVVLTYPVAIGIGSLVNTLEGTFSSPAFLSR
jgi:hypothetical protein